MLSTFLSGPPGGEWKQPQAVTQGPGKVTARPAGGCHRWTPSDSGSHAKKADAYRMALCLQLPSRASGSTVKPKDPKTALAAANRAASDSESESETRGLFNSESEQVEHKKATRFGGSIRAGVSAA